MNKIEKCRYKNEKCHVSLNNNKQNYQSNKCKFKKPIVRLFVKKSIIFIFVFTFVKHIQNHDH